MPNAKFSLIQCFIRFKMKSDVAMSSHKQIEIPNETARKENI